MGEKQLVYIVEDDASIRELEIYALKKPGYKGDMDVNISYIG